MNLDLYAIFILSSVALLLLPGPNVSVIVANSISHGIRFGLMTVVGTTLATVVQLSFVGFGLSGLLLTFSEWFEWIRWVGVLYLLYLAFIAFRSAGKQAAEEKPQGYNSVGMRGFLVSMLNPKTLLFFGAFLPQFIDPRGDALSQLLILSGTYVMLAAVIDTGWALLAGQARHLLRAHRKSLDRFSGGALLAAAATLAVARHN